jgi:heme exporter protein D
MQFESVSAFLDMGGYGFYVWLSFGVSLLALGILAFDAVRQQKVLFNAVEKEQARKIRIKAAKASVIDQNKSSYCEAQASPQKEEVK